MASFYRSGYRSGYSSGYQAGLPPQPAVGPPLTGLAAWYRADSGVTKTGSNVTAWADQSGNGQNLAATTTPPVLNASSVNGLPGITFTGSTPLTRATSPLTAGSDRTVIVVCKPVAGTGTFSPGGPTVVFKADNTACWQGYAAGLGATVFGYTGVALTSPVASPPTILNTPIAFEISSTVAAIPAFVINGTSYAPGSVTVVANDNGTDGFAVGGKVVSTNWATQFFAGDICEVLIYSHILAGANLTQVRAYLTSRYGVA